MFNIEIDTRANAVWRDQLANEASRLDNVWQRIQLAEKIVEAQRRLAKDDPEARRWTLEHALNYLDPANAGSDVAAGIADLNSIEMAVEPVVDENPA